MAAVILVLFLQRKLYLMKALPLCQKYIIIINSSKCDVTIISNNRHQQCEKVKYKGTIEIIKKKKKKKWSKNTVLCTLNTVILQQNRSINAVLRQNRIEIQHIQCRTTIIQSIWIYLKIVFSLFSVKKTRILKMPAVQIPM